jgi:hypothetical protein
MKNKNLKSLHFFGITLIFSAIPASAAGFLNGDTTVKKQAPEFGNFSIEGINFKMGLETLPGTVGNGYGYYYGGSPGNQFNNGQLTIRNLPTVNNSIPSSGYIGYKSDILFSAESATTSWAWSQVNKSGGFGGYYGSDFSVIDSQELITLIIHLTFTGSLNIFQIFGIPMATMVSLMLEMNQKSFSILGLAMVKILHQGILVICKERKMPGS